MDPQMLLEATGMEPTLGGGMLGSWRTFTPFGLLTHHSIPRILLSKM